MESTGKDLFPSFILVTVGFRLLSATQGRWRGGPISAVSCSGGQILNCKLENIINYIFVTAVPRIFSALHMNVPPSFLDMLIFKTPFFTVFLSGKLPIALDHEMVGRG